MVHRLGLWCSSMSQWHSETPRTIELMIYGQDLISRRGMFQSNRDRLIKDGWLGFYEMVIYSRASVAGPMTSIRLTKLISLVLILTTDQTMGGTGWLRLGMRWCVCANSGGSRELTGVKWKGGSSARFSVGRRPK
jgi:hypothetical protein